jgi:FKBP-type peptidyl-prolyl cis-trans isomerase 2
VDPAQGTYTEDFNQEVQGQTLIFVVTVQDIFP